MSKLEKVAVRKEPKRKHYYQVEVTVPGYPIGHEYLATSLAEVREICEEQSKGSSMQVFKVEYNFVQAYKRK